MRLDGRRRRQWIRARPRHRACLRRRARRQHRGGDHSRAGRHVRGHAPRDEPVDVTDTVDTAPSPSCWSRTTRRLRARSPPAWLARLLGDRDRFGRGSDRAGRATAPGSRAPRPHPAGSRRAPRAAPPPFVHRRADRRAHRAERQEPTSWRLSTAAPTTTSSSPSTSTSCWRESAPRCAVARARGPGGDRARRQRRDRPGPPACDEGRRRRPPHADRAPLPGVAGAERRPARHLLRTRRARSRRRGAASSTRTRYGCSSASSAASSVTTPPTPSSSSPTSGSATAGSRATTTTRDRSRRRRRRARRCAVSYSDMVCGHCVTIVPLGPR